MTRHSFSMGWRPRFALSICLSLVLAACIEAPETDPMPEATSSDMKASVVATPENWPPIAVPIAKDEALEKEIDEILARMSLEHKVGQIIQADIGSVTPEDVRRYHLGSVLNGGNSAPGGNLRASPDEWLALADAFWEASMTADGPGIPIIWGTDAVHGHSNVTGATVFPHNIGLGATRDATLIEAIGAATAREVAVTGLDWTFAPTLAVALDDRWGRSYESYAEDPALVAELGAALVVGLQGAPGSDAFLGHDKVVATSKHFVGDGGTLDGRDQGETIASEAELRDIHAAGYVTTLEAGVQSVMASFSSWEGRKMHGREDLLTDLLKHRWRFDGMVVGDWNGHGQIEGCTAEDCPDAVNAGLDLYMAPDSWKNLYRSTLAHVRSGRIAESRLEDAVRRVLRTKLRAGLFDKPKPSERPLAANWALLGGVDHTDLAREAVRKSAVLLKNNANVLPLQPKLRVLIAGAAADDLSMLSGGWTLSWQGDGVSKADFPNSETILDGVRRVVSAAGGETEYSAEGEWNENPDAAIVVFGEAPYAEFRGDIATLDYKPGDDRDLAMLKRLRMDGIPTIAVFLSGRPLWVNPELNASDAFVAAFLPGAQAGALADILFSDEAGNVTHDFSGRLSFSWPEDADQYRLNPDDPGYEPLFPFGYGLTYADRENIGPLHKNAVVADVDYSILFDRGAPLGEWKAFLADGEGVSEWRSGRTSSPTGALTAQSADLGQQENAVRLAWNGNGAARYVMQHEAVDLTREVDAQFELIIDYLVEIPAEGPVSLTFTCGDDCASAFDVSESFQLSPDAGVSSLAIPLNCLTQYGVDVAQIDTFSLSASARLTAVISRIAIAPRTEPSECPTLAQ